MITAPGIMVRAAEHKVGWRGRWAAARELPVLVDREDPARFAILWSEASVTSWRERQRAQTEANRLNGG